LNFIVLSKDGLKMGNFLKQFALRLLPGAILGLLLIGGIAAIPDSKVERAKASLLILDYEPLPDDGEFFPPQDF
jgi:hypothetical protein